MKYPPLIEGVFEERPNRFIAKIWIDDVLETVHVKNTGRCKELLTKGARVLLEPSNNPSRKTKYSLISVYKGQRLINMDSQVPNLLVKEAILKNQIKSLKDTTLLKAEVTKGDSRFDFYYETETRKGYIEVKGCTLENQGKVKFPDAPTTRGKKHVDGLIDLAKEGFQNYIFFVIQMENVTQFTVNRETDPAFSESVIKAKKNGVGILVYDCLVDRQSIAINQPVEFVESGF